MCNRFQRDIDRLIYEFEHPSAEFSPMPFWFWNDTLNEEELSRQIHAFKEKGVDGFVIHPRLGLDPNILYMGERWLSFVRYAVELAEKMDMKVILYDEAMYPSGSCCGQVVAENAAFCAKGLRMSYSCDLEQGETLIAQTKWKGIPHYFILTPTNGTIRGAYFGQDDKEPSAPLAADLLNTQAVATFIRLTHQKYYDSLSEYFGKTIIAIFTDEPSLKGRCGKRNIISWTDDFLDDFLSTGCTVEQLPALFDKEFEDSKKICNYYDQAIFKRMNTCYYGQISTWCNEHGIALTGHPEKSDDIYRLSYFDIPCQDIVWRYIAPGEYTNINGAHSTMAKCASDSARHRGKRRNGNECFGVCGHKDDPYAFDRSDMKWYIDWLFVRGCNFIVPHAFYYSLRDTRRDERPPEVGMHSSFWNEYREISDYIKRCCAINTDSVNVTDVVILGFERYLPDIPAHSLYENQIEFNYIERSLLENAIVDNGALCIANQKYRIIIVEKEPDEVTAKALASLHELGVTVLDYSKYQGNEKAYLSDIRNKSRTLTDLDVHKDLRLTRVRKYGIEIVYLTNEGETSITTTIREPIVQIWDSEQGTRSNHDKEPLTLTLAPRKSIHLIMDDVSLH